MREYISSLLSDVRITLRQFRKSPIVLLTCVLVLGLGLGGTTAAFSALYTVVLHPLPYADSGRLVAVHSQFPRLHMPRLGVSPPDYRDLIQYRHLFSNAGAFFYQQLSRTGLEHAQKVNAVAVTASLFQTLGVKPAMGRYFTDAEQQPGGPHVVLLSNTYWRTSLGHDPDVLHMKLLLNGESYSVIGVMPPSFQFPNNLTQMWVPAVFTPAQFAPSGRQNVFLHMYARLAPRITFAEASKQLDRISRDAILKNRGEYSVDITGWKYFIVPLASEKNSSLHFWTWVFFAAVMVLFMIVCLNVSSLLALRSTQRAFETSVRVALGAGWLRIVRQYLCEGTVICIIGGFAGLLAALMFIHVLSRANEFGELHLAVPVFVFGLVMVIVTAGVCSSYPLWMAARNDPANLLSTGGHQRTGSRGRRYSRRTLVVFQVAASTVLLVTGGLLLHTFINLLNIPLGFDPERVMTMQISLPALRYPSESSRRIFYESVLNRIRQMPGVNDASACTVLPFGYGETVQPFSVPRAPKGQQVQFADADYIFPRFFHTMRIPLLLGRHFDNRDVPDSEPVVIVDQKLAQEYFPHQSAVGEQIDTGGHHFLIIGVADNIKMAGLDVSDRPVLYFNAVQMPKTEMSIVLKGSMTIKQLPELVQDIVTKLDPNQAVYNIASLQSLIEQSLSTRQFVAFLLISFAAGGTLITAIGLYGFLAYSVVLRGHELGIRAALGARPIDLAVLVLQNGIALILIGVVLGGFVALWVSRYLSSELYGVRLSDPVTWLSVAGVLGGTGLLACAIPSWRAAHVNITLLLKHE